MKKIDVSLKKHPDAFALLVTGGYPPGKFAECVKAGVLKAKGSDPMKWLKCAMDYATRRESGAIASVMDTVSGEIPPNGIARCAGKYKAFRVFYTTDRAGYITLCIGHRPSFELFSLFAGVGEIELSRKAMRQMHFNRLLTLVSDADKSDLISFFSVINGDEPPRGLR